jgi:deferrochelatase/peroxidase EfeB/cytochrome P450
MVNSANASLEQTRSNVQAHLLRASKFKIDNGEATRNWSLFFFFRILTQAEFDATVQRMQRAAADAAGAKRELWLDFTHPAILNAGLVAQRLADAASSAPDGPAQAFLDWLKVITSADKSGLQQNAGVLAALPGAASTATEAGTRTGGTGLDLTDPIASIADACNAQRVDADLIRQVLQLHSQPEQYLALLQKLRDGSAAAPRNGAVGPLPGVVLYELLRQGAPAMVNSKPTPSSHGIVRGEANAHAGVVEGDPGDVTPINVAFTYSGLAALKLDQTTLKSFPDAFKQGMAARAQRLRDTGPSAPEHWDGELGLPSVHGYFSGGSPLKKGDAVKESFWKAMRADVAAFNDPVDVRGRLLRFWLHLLYRVLGLEIVHIELGQDPYTVDEASDTVQCLQDRVEHFGFRDGLSQPFVDMKLGDTPPGGGTPGRDGTWTPVAPGEILLDQFDEDGDHQLLPISRKLTVGATFLVFRKLEQDVAGFRAFLSWQRPKDGEAQKALAAQFVGRWPNGTPLVLSPEAEHSAEEQSEATLNNFRYAADDPSGAKCPLGAHIRRANPRDIGGRSEARRHRILRRAISYGGPLLKQGVLSDGERRGLLFIAANSRIDLQFEVIQADWINGGEFLGQAGLGRCPLVGAHDGVASDGFLEAGAAAPVVGLPRFVVTRGGDYFFAPGIATLKLLANGAHFEPEQDETPFGGFAMADVKTPALFDPDRLTGYGQAILSGEKTAVHLDLPSSATQGSYDKVCFVGLHSDVRKVLRNEQSASGTLEFSVRHYHLAAQNITRGRDIIISTDAFGPTDATRTRLHAILNKAWWALADALKAEGMDKVVRGIVKSVLDMTLRRTAQALRIDLVKDLAAQATYAVVEQLYGIPGPQWLTELAVALPFARQHVGALPPDWIAALQGEKPDNPGLATMQVWSAVILADLVGNLQSIAELHAISRQAGSEMLDYIDSQVSLERASPIRSPETLLEAFIKNEDLPEIAALYDQDGTPPGQRGDWKPRYYSDVSAILLELVGTSMATIPLTFASVMQALFKFRIDLPSLLGSLPASDVPRLIYEAERLNPNVPVRMRYCETTTALPGGAEVKEGEWVAALIGAANLDPRVFQNPYLFSFDPKIRDIKNYLLFNDQGNNRQCWGRERVAMAVLEECVMAAGRLRGLRGVAGAGGEPVKLAQVTIGLPARFTQVASTPER